MSRAGAIAGVLAGGLTVIIWRQLEGGLFDLYEIVPGVLCATTAIIIFSRLRPPVPDPASGP
jgi:sodium/proline symporter